MGKILIFNFKTDSKDSIFGVTTDWINAFASKYDKVVVVTSWQGTLDLSENVEVYSLGVENGAGLFAKLTRFVKLMRMILKKNEFNLVFYHMTYHFVLLSWPFLVFKKAKRFLWYAHKSTPITLRIAHHFVHKVLTTSEKGFQLSSKKKEIIGHGISEERFKYHAPNQHEKFRIISTARISRIKDLNNIIEAFKVVIKKNNAVELRIVGGVYCADDRKYKKELQAQINEEGSAGLAEIITGIPFDKITKELHKADLMINLSRTGSVDKSVLEGLMAGVPVLALKDDYKDAFPGGLAQRMCLLDNSSPEHVAAKIIALMNMSTEEKEVMTKELSKKTVEGYGLKNFTEKISQINKKLITS